MVLPGENVVRSNYRKHRSLTASFRDTDDALTRLAILIVAANDEGRPHPRTVAIVRRADKKLRG